MTITYTDIYLGLMSHLKKEVASKEFVRNIVVTYFLCLIASIYIVSSHSNSPSIWLYIGSWMLLTFIALVLIGLVFFVTAIWTGSSDRTSTEEIAAWLLVGVSRPYSRERGLNAKGLKEILKVAEVEQNAAGWRGNSITWVWTLILLFVFDIPQSIASFFAGQPEPDAGTTIEVIEWPWYFGVLNTISSWFLLIVGVAILVFLIWRMLAYFVDFLGGEAPNRIMLLACIEAQAVLNTLNLEESRVLSKSEKHLAIGLLGFRLASDKKRGNAQFQFQEGQQTYHLKRIEPYSVFDWFRYVLLGRRKKRRIS